MFRGETDAVGCSNKAALYTEALLENSFVAKPYERTLS